MLGKKFEKTKKLMVVLISFLLIISLAACGMSKDSKKNEGNMVRCLYSVVSLKEVSTTFLQKL